MKKHWLAGLIVGGVFGITTAVIAASTAWPEGGLVAFAAAFDGIMGGLGIGWLIGINISAGDLDMEDDAYVQLAEQRKHQAAQLYQQAA
jgi:hypothetical protein